MLVIMEYVVEVKVKGDERITFSGIDRLIIVAMIIALGNRLSENPHPLICFLVEHCPFCNNWDLHPLNKLPDCPFNYFDGVRS